jgi:hypothetical protein
MSYLTGFLWYLAAFAVGAVVVWLVIRSKVGATSEEDAYADLLEKEMR